MSKAEQNTGELKHADLIALAAKGRTIEYRTPSADWAPLRPEQAIRTMLNYPLFQYREGKAPKVLYFRVLTDDHGQLAIGAMRTRPMQVDQLQGYQLRRTYKMTVDANTFEATLTVEEEVDT